MTFQALDLKGKQFLDLLDKDNNIIKPSYTKEESWLKIFSHSNSLCTCALWAITNHTLIGEYRLRFFPRKEFKCPYSSYPIEIRYYILHECNRFNRYWNPRRDSLGHLTMFLVTNLSAFVSRSLMVDLTFIFCFLFYFIFLFFFYFIFYF